MSPERESMPYCYFKKVAFNHVKNVAHVAKYKFQEVQKTTSAPECILQ